MANTPQFNSKDFVRLGLDIDQRPTVGPTEIQFRDPSRLGLNPGDWIVVRTVGAEATLVVAGGGNDDKYAAVAPSVFAKIGEGTIEVREYGWRDRLKQLGWRNMVVVALGLLVAVAGVYEDLPWVDEPATTSDYREVIDELAGQVQRSDDASASTADLADSLAGGLQQISDESVVPLAEVGGTLPDGTEIQPTLVVASQIVERDRAAVGRVATDLAELVSSLDQAGSAAVAASDELDGKADDDVFTAGADWVKLVGGLLIAGFAAWEGLRKKSVPG